MCTLGERLHVQYECVCVCTYTHVSLFLSSSVHEDSYANGGMRYGMLTCVNIHAHISIHVQINAPVCVAVCVLLGCSTDKRNLARVLARLSGRSAHLLRASWLLLWTMWYLLLCPKRGEGKRLFSSAACSTGRPLPPP